MTTQKVEKPRHPKTLIGMNTKQELVLLILADGTERSGSRLAGDLRLDYQQVYPALRALWLKGLVERKWQHGEIRWWANRNGLRAVDPA